MQNFPRFEIGFLRPCDELADEYREKFSRGDMLSESTNVFKSLRSNAGQAVIEYLLVLLVTVAIILGVIYQFNDAFRVYAKSYFGDYLACLLETGELPSIGGEGNGICNALFEGFTIDNGRPLVGAGFQRGGSASSSKKDEETSKSTKSDSEGGGGSRYIAKNSGGGGGGVRSRGSSRSGGEFEGGSKKPKNNYTGSSNVSIPPTTFAGGGGRGSEYNTYSGIDSYVERRRVDEKEETNKIAMKASNTAAKDPQRLRVNRQVATIKQDKPESEFTIGNFLRIMLILAIIIALIVFLGGQALQISKSMD